MSSFRRFVSDDRGATAIEYGLIVALVFLAIVASLNSYSTKVGLMYNNISNNMR